MPERSRLERRDDFLTGLGMLASPIRDLIQGGPGEIPKVPFVRGKFARDFPKYGNELIAFGREGAVTLDRETAAARRAVGKLNDVLTLIESNDGSAAEVLEETIREAQAAIRKIPVDDPDTILPSESPYNTYLRLRAICASATRRVEVFDPYLDSEVFHLYLSEVHPDADLVVLTAAAIMKPNTSDPRSIARRDRIVGVSSLLAVERPTSYRFLVTTQQHDRHVRVDDNIIHLGGSLKDAARKAPYTISDLDATQSNHAFLDNLVATSEEWYGPAASGHRRA